MGVTFVTKTEPLQTTIHRRELHLVGNAHDIERLVQAGKKKLEQIERSRTPLDEMVNLHVEPPQDDEP